MLKRRTDHMKGLRAPVLQRRLECSLKLRLYCSPVTKEILLTSKKYKFWENYITAIEVETPTQISLIDEATGKKEDIVVTLLPAGHCPGSVMFLFEGMGGTVLYTGDFRLAKGEAARLEFLHSGGRVKDISTVYLDTTFCDPRFYQIPSREECLNGILELVGSWITLSPYHVVWLNCKAAYGYEYLFTHLSEEFGVQVHLNKLDMFKNMPEILHHVTTDRLTQIHACRYPRDELFGRGNRLPCGIKAKDGTPLRIISIKPSTMWFGERMKRTNVIVRTGESSYRACFSFHSSFSEIKDFISYIQPVTIYPNVVPIGKTYEETREFLKTFCRKGSRQEATYRPLGKLKRSRQNLLNQEDADYNDLFDDCHPIPSKRVSCTPQLSPPTGETPEHNGDVLTDGASEQTVCQNPEFFDCEESNDEDEDDEIEEVRAKDDASLTQCQQSADPTERWEKGTAACETDTPPWGLFFKQEPASVSETDEGSENVGEQEASPHSLKLFSDSEDGDSTFFPSQTSSQSTHISEQGSQGSLFGKEPVHAPDNRADSLKFPNSNDKATLNLMRLGKVSTGEQPQNYEPPSCPSSIQCSSHPVINVSIKDTPSRLSNTNTASCLPEGREQSVTSGFKSDDSQTSSEFEISPTPDCELPPAEELNVIYCKLAAGEAVKTEKHKHASGCKL
ncbi:protein artemis isoform X2 [Hypanus sabinus]|uniref:protein artemis isoform X2 n=1 Tax=Hypanus sabinus TaxID=79690 RepID=UPI0028C4DE49|nr:protein artemis isoform X2 [Hypanus sabinus]